MQPPCCCFCTSTNKSAQDKTHSLPRWVGTFVDRTPPQYNIAFWRMTREKAIPCKVNASGCLDMCHTTVIANSACGSRHRSPKAVCLSTRYPSPPTEEKKKKNQAPDKQGGYPPSVPPDKSGLRQSDLPQKLIYHQTQNSIAARNPPSLHPKDVLLSESGIGHLATFQPACAYWEPRHQRCGSSLGATTSVPGDTQVAAGAGTGSTALLYLTGPHAQGTTDEIQTSRLSSATARPFLLVQNQKSCVSDATYGGRVLGTTSI